MPIRDQPQSMPNNAEDLLAFIQAHLPQLWRVQHHGGNRALRIVLNSAERLSSQEQSADTEDNTSSKSRRR